MYKSNDSNYQSRHFYYNSFYCLPGTEQVTWLINTVLLIRELKGEDIYVITIAPFFLYYHRFTNYKKRHHNLRQVEGARLDLSSNVQFMLHRAMHAYNLTFIVKKLMVVAAASLRTRLTTSPRVKPSDIV